MISYIIHSFAFCVLFSIFLFVLAIVISVKRRYHKKIRHQNECQQKWPSKLSLNVRGVIISSTRSIRDTYSVPISLLLLGRQSLHVSISSGQWVTITPIL